MRHHFGFIGLLLLVLCSFLAAGQIGESYHLKLLAVQEIPQGYAGSDADLYVELKPGSGRVFLETFPLTKMDTQISTRFAKEIACYHFQLPCEKYDFIYTIKAKSNIIGGPSAGAAIAALTSIAVLDLPYDESITITGTINSGGVVGPVGGLKEKLEAAERVGLLKVLIAQGSFLGKNISGSDNSSRNDSASGNDTVSGNVTQNITVPKSSLIIQEVADLDEVVLALTGVDLDHKDLTIYENPAYQEIMGKLQEKICRRTEKIQQELEEESLHLLDEEKEPFQRRAGQAQNATAAGDYYSAASFCFSNNIQLKKYFYSKKKLTTGAYDRLFEILERKVVVLEEQLAQEEVNTISDVQALSIVEERLHDVREQFQELPGKTPEELASLLAYAEERYFSALAWKEFLGMEGQQFAIDTLALEQSCQLKIAESEERFQYVSLFLGEGFLPGIQERITAAEEARQKKEYPLCLMVAGQAKAHANAVLSSLGVQEEALPLLLNGKRKAVERVIAENTASGLFPILGYSYYQYAQSLETEDPGSALLYLEYALEMSDLGMYFPEKQNRWAAFFTLPPSVGILIIGLLLGVGGTLFFLNRGGKWNA